MSKDEFDQAAASSIRTLAEDAGILAPALNQVGEQRVEVRLEFRLTVDATTEDQRGNAYAKVSDAIVAVYDSGNWSMDY